MSKYALVKTKNPDEDEHLELVEEEPKPKRRRSNPKAVTVYEPGQPMMIGGAIAGGYLLWCLITYLTSQPRVWSWTPWRSLSSLSRPALKARVEASRNNPQSYIDVGHARPPIPFTNPSDYGSACVF